MLFGWNDPWSRFENPRFPVNRSGGSFKAWSPWGSVTQPFGSNTLPRDLTLDPSTETLRIAPGQQKSGNVFRVGIFLISVGSPHVLRAHMGHTCGEPNEIELTAAHRSLHRSFSVPELKALRLTGSWKSGGQQASVGHLL